MVELAVSASVALGMLEAGWQDRDHLDERADDDPPRVGAYGPPGAAVEALGRVMVADLDGTTVSVTLLLPGGAAATGMLSERSQTEAREQLLDPAIIGPPIVWLSSQHANSVHNRRLVATEFNT